MKNQISTPLENQKGKSILIVDDENYICRTISRWLEPEGYSCRTANSVDQALELIKESVPDLLISDIMMPGKSGIDLLKECKSEHPDIAVLMATAVDNREIAISALQHGAYGYMIKPFDKNEFVINVVNAFERLRLTLISKNYESMLEKEVRDRTTLIRRREEEIANRLVWAAEYRDDETGEHIKRIGLFSAALASSLGWTPDDVDDLRVSAPMHDIGKIGISDTILCKPGKLTDEEFELIKTHTTIGASILDKSNIGLLQLAHNIALSHHEKWDGSGYPYGLAEEAIPEAARIVAIADVYDALVYDRVYRPALAEEEAISIIKMGCGKHFQPLIFECFLDILPELQAIKKKVVSLTEIYR